MKRIGIFLGLGLLVMWLLPANIGFAFPFDKIIRTGEVYEDDLVVFGDQLTVEEGAVIEGDVSVFGGNAEIAGIVEGDISVMGGNVELDGELQGDLVLFGGNFTVGEDAIISGDCATMGGNLAGNTNFDCNHMPIGEIDNLMNGLPVIPELGDFPFENAPHPTRSRWTGIGGNLISAIGRTLLMGGLAWLVASVWSPNVRRVSDTIVQRPIASGIMGVLSAGAFASVYSIVMLISGILILACGIGLLGVPVLMIMAGVGIAAGVIGWVALGQLFGNRLNRQLRVSPNKEVNVAVTGTMALTLLLGLATALPSVLGSSFFAWLAMVTLGFIGFGAATLTKLGKQNYPLVPAGNPSKIETIIEETLPDEFK